MSSYDHVYTAAETIREKVFLAAQRSGRDFCEIQLLAVTKFHPFEAVLAAYNAGIRIFGENRVQEAGLKFGTQEAKELSGYSLHMIGNLQSNKIGKAVELFNVIQSIGDKGCLEKVTSNARFRGKNLGLYLELHTGEATKGGFLSVDEMLYAIDEFLEFTKSGTCIDSKESISIQGLMTMAPFLAEDHEIRQSFRKLANARNAILNRFSEITNLQLSMGMSSDFEMAIEEGSTLIRIGSALFGERKSI